MNRLFIGIWILACLFAGCSDDKEDNGGGDEGGTSELAVSPEELVFGSEGGEKTFTIRTEEYWQVGYPVFWFEASPRTGTGDATISAIARANEEYDDRNFNLTVQTLSGQTKVMTVTQKKKDAILLTKDKYDMESEGGNFDVEVKSNVTYTVSIQEDCREWIKQVDLGRGLETRMVHFEVAANPDAEKREGMIVFKDDASELADTVHVYQARLYELILSESEVYVPTEGKEVSVELRSNVDYEVIIPREASEWIALLEGRSSRVDRLVFNVLENTTHDNRSADIVVRDKHGELADTLVIHQVQKDALVISRDTYEVSAEGEDITVEVKSNVDYEATVLAGAGEWIQRVEKGRALVTTELHYKVLANPTYAAREGRIVIKEKKSELADTVKIVQAARDGNVVLATEQDLIDLRESGLTVVMGDLTIKGGALKTLQQLNNQITEVKGNLIVNAGNLTSLEGLYGIEKVGGDLRLSAHVLSNLEGLNNLVEIDGNFEVENITSFEGMGGLERIGGNFRLSGKCRGLKSFQGLNNLWTIGGDFDIETSSEVSSLNELSSFEGLERLASIGGSFRVIASTYTPTSSGDMRVSALNTLVSFKGLSGLKCIGGDFEVKAFSSSTTSYTFPIVSSSSLSALESFEGLESLETVGGSFRVIASSVSRSSSYMSISSSSLDALSSFEGLSSLKSIGGDFEVNASSAFSDYYSSSSYPAYSLGSLASFKGLEGLEKVGGDFRIKAIASNYNNRYSSLNGLESFEGLSNLKDIGGDFEVETSYSLNDLESFKGLGGLTNIAGNFRVIVNYSHSLDALKSFNGLDGLETIGGDFELKLSSYSLDALVSFEGLGGLVRVGGRFRINASYSSLEALVSFKGLGGLKTIGSDFELSDMAALVSLDGLESLTSIGGNFNLAELRKLTSLGGLLGLTSITGKLLISDCPLLNNIGGLANLMTVTDISVTNCKKLYGFCALKAVVESTGCPFYTAGNGFNPTKYQLLNGECSREPEVQ